MPGAMYHQQRGHQDHPRPETDSPVALCLLTFLPPMECPVPPTDCLVPKTKPPKVEGILQMKYFLGTG